LEFRAFFLEFDGLGRICYRYLVRYLEYRCVDMCDPEANLRYVLFTNIVIVVTKLA
jgi:hypothetical protein